MDTHFEQAKNCFLQGVRLYEAGQFEQAQTQFLASLSLVPGRSSTLMNQGATQIKLGQFAQAVPVLEEALRSQPDDAETRGHLATALAELGRPREALAHAEAGRCGSTRRPLCCGPCEATCSRSWGVQTRPCRRSGRRWRTGGRRTQSLLPCGPGRRGYAAGAAAPLCAGAVRWLRQRIRRPSDAGAALPCAGHPGARPGRPALRSRARPGLRHRPVRPAAAADLPAPHGRRSVGQHGRPGAGARRVRRGRAGRSARLPGGDARSMRSGDRRRRDDLRGRARRGVRRGSQRVGARRRVCFHRGTRERARAPDPAQQPALRALARRHRGAGAAEPPGIPGPRAASHPRGPGRAIEGLFMWLVRP